VFGVGVEGEGITFGPPNGGTLGSLELDCGAACWAEAVLWFRQAFFLVLSVNLRGCEMGKIPLESLEE
jgi:hypothetical protein